MKVNRLCLSLGRCIDLKPDLHASKFNPVRTGFTGRRIGVPSGLSPDEGAYFVRHWHSAADAISALKRFNIAQGDGLWVALVEQDVGGSRCWRGCFVWRGQLNEVIAMIGRSLERLQGKLPPEGSTFLTG